MSKQSVITRRDLAIELAAQSGLSDLQATTLMTRVVNLIIDHLRQGHVIELRGLGRFEVLPTAARPGRNPKTGEPCAIPAGRRHRFRASKKLTRLLGVAP